MTGGSLSLRQLRDRGFTDAKIVEMGGEIQGRNVVFADRIGGFDSTGEILKLPARARRRTFIDTLDADERAIVEAIDAKPKGVGDTLAALFEKIGADKAGKLYEKITGRACGCSARRKWLNKWWPYKT